MRWAGTSVGSESDNILGVKSTAVSKSPTKHPNTLSLYRKGAHILTKETIHCILGNNLMVMNCRSTESTLFFSRAQASDLGSLLIYLSRVALTSKGALTFPKLR
jgi:hypothetical protein